MYDNDRIWMTPQTRQSLETELAELLALPNPAEGEDGERTDQVVDAWLARKERIREIHELLSKADGSTLPADDGIVEPGMVVTVRYDDAGDTESFLLGTRGTSDTELDVYTVNSPLGSALLGAKPGEQRSYQLPNGTIQQVTVLTAKPFGAHELDSAAAG
ncbi:GreA/GreB family elongation factor [Mycobacterium sp. pV006]|uniref:GreA/GreB family elongation factor n=1 Tax=Mycobacterium sp. pV006 TaxID=3238983 RepID=UPI00351BBB9A